MKKLRKLVDDLLVKTMDLSNNCSSCLGGIVAAVVLTVLVLSGVL